MEIITIRAQSGNIVARALAVQPVDSESLIAELCALTVEQFLQTGHKLTRQAFTTASNQNLAPVIRIR